jgi:hypothetical protein
MANRPIPISEANDMIQYYLGYMSEHHVDMNKQTHSVSFTAPELMQWLNEVMPYADELRVCEGVYLPGHEHAGRITVILWPYKNGKPATRPDGDGKSGGNNGINPYNHGQGNP